MLCYEDGAVHTCIVGGGGSVHRVHRVARV